MADSPGSKRSMQGYILTYSRIKRNNSNTIYVKRLHKKDEKEEPSKAQGVSRGGLTSASAVPQGSTAICSEDTESAPER